MMSLLKANEKTAPRICSQAWELYDKWAHLADTDGESMANIRKAWADYKAHRAVCSQCDPVGRYE